MPKLIWDAVGARMYETGVDRGVLYIRDETGAYPLGVAWNGLVGVSESPTGGEPEAIYADNIKYLTLMSTEEFGATIEAYTYPDAWAACDGSASPAIGVSVGQQARSTFGLCYRTLIGNDVNGQSHGYKIHLVYGALAATSEKAYQTINDSPEAITFSWDITTTPVAVGVDYKPTASLVIDSTKIAEAKLVELETLLYGSEAIAAALPLPEAVIALVNAV